MATCAMAQSYPGKPIHIIVPYSAGGSTDAIARTLAQGLSRRFKIEVVVENKPGGNTIIATHHVASAKPDGYTLYVTNTAPYSMLPSMYRKLPYIGEKDYTPIALIADIQLGMFLSRERKLADLPSFVNAARANPGRLVYSHTGVGQIPAVAFEMLKSQLKLDLVAVPYPGSPGVIQSLLAGDSHAAINDLGTMMPHVRSGALTPVAVLADRRLPALPDVPTLKETGLPIDIPTVWVGVVGPAGIPPDVVAVLNKAINEEMQTPEAVAMLNGRFHTPRVGTPADFDAAIKQDFRVWAPAIKRLGLALD